MAGLTGAKAGAEMDDCAASELFIVILGKPVNETSMRTPNIRKG
jgi:hypothetical protein